MYSHMMVGSNDIERSKKFYDATFTAIGGQPGIVDDKGRLIYMYNDGLFLVTKPIDGAPASPGNGMTIGIAMETTEQADAWHAAGVANGGKAIEDPPGVRVQSGWQPRVQPCWPPRARPVRSASVRPQADLLPPLRWQPGTALRPSAGPAALANAPCLSAAWRR